MRFTVSLYADDLLGLERTDTPADENGRAQYSAGPNSGEPYGYFTPDELEKIAGRLIFLAVQARVRPTR